MTFRRDKILQLAKGFRGRAKNCYKLALRRVVKGLQHAYRGRKLKKRIARREWIGQVGAGAREHGLAYSHLVRGLSHSLIGVNRKMLAHLAHQEPYSFRAILDVAKGSLFELMRRHDQATSSLLPDELDRLASPTMLSDTYARSTVDRGLVLPYEGIPQLPPHKPRAKHFS